MRGSSRFSTTAVPAGDFFEVTGEKLFITNVVPGRRHGLQRRLCTGKVHAFGAAVGLTGIGNIDAGDARTQFYIAYAFYRQGWGRVYNDDALFRQGLEAIERAISLSADAPLEVEDPELKIHSAAELKAELRKGTERSADDLNPLKVFRERK